MFKVKNTLSLVVVLAVVGAAVWLWKQHYTVAKKVVSEGFNPLTKGVQPSYDEVSQNAVPQAVPKSASAGGSNDRLTSDQLLPSGAVEKSWSSVVQVPKSEDQITNYLSAGKHVYITSPGSVNKNANLSLRADPQIPKTKVSPFLNSSYEPINPAFVRGVDINELPSQ